MVGKARFRWRRAPGNRRVHRPRPARSRTCTLDALHVRRTSRFRRALGRVTAEDSTSAPVGAARCVARKCSPRECDQCRPPRSARATCRATRRAVRPPTEHTTRTRSVRVARELTSRGRCPARRVLAPAPRQIDANAGHLSEGRRTSEKTESGKSDPRSGVRAAAESVISYASHGRIKIAISARSSSKKTARFPYANEKSRIRRILESRTQDD
jgi:hypothetical protein